MLRLLSITALLAACGSSAKPAAAPPPPPPKPLPPQVYDAPAQPATLEAGFRFEVVEQRTDRWGEDVRTSNAAWGIELTRIDPPQVITFRFHTMPEIWKELTDKTLVLTISETGPALTDETGASFHSYAITPFMQGGGLAVPELSGHHLEKDVAVAIDHVTLSLLCGFQVGQTATSASMTLTGVSAEGIATIAFEGKGDDVDAGGQPITYELAGTVELDSATKRARAVELAIDRSPGIASAQGHRMELKRTFSYD